MQFATWWTRSATRTTKFHHIMSTIIVACCVDCTIPPPWKHLRFSNVNPWQWLVAVWCVSLHLNKFFFEHHDFRFLIPNQLAKVHSFFISIFEPHPEVRWIFKKAKMFSWWWSKWHWRVSVPLCSLFNVFLVAQMGSWKWISLYPRRIAVCGSMSVTAFCEKRRNIYMFSQTIWSRNSCAVSDHGVLFVRGCCECCCEQRRCFWML